MKGEVRWTRQTSILIIGYVLLLTITQAVNKTKEISSDPCHVEFSVPTADTLPNFCSTCVDRCGNICSVTIFIKRLNY